MAHVLYRFYSDTGQLLYVGITMNPAQRFHSHKHTKDWWDDVVGITLQHYLDRESLAAAERRAIEVERPLHNIVRPKMKGVPVAASLQPSPPQPELAEEAVTVPPDLFKPKTDIASLFGDLGKWGRDRQKELDDRRRAKWDAIDACGKCDATGYWGKSVCWHPEGDRKSQRDRLQIIQGGGA